MDIPNVTPNIIEGCQNPPGVDTLEVVITLVLVTTQVHVLQILNDFTGHIRLHFPYILFRENELECRKGIKYTHCDRVPVNRLLLSKLQLGVVWESGYL